MWKLIKFLILSLILIFLLLPTWMFGASFYNYMTNNWLPYEFQPYAHMTQSLESFMNGDDVKIAKQDCIDNNYHGASTIEDCIEHSMMALGASLSLLGMSVFVFPVLAIIFTIYLIFYIRWFRRNYFNKKIS